MYLTLYLRSVRPSIHSSIAWFPNLLCLYTPQALFFPKIEHLHALMKTADYNIF
jgi:hypothetical protein